MTFLLIDSHDLLAVKKAGNARLERVFEVTEDIMATLPTSVVARWYTTTGLIIDAAGYNVVPDSDPSGESE